MEQRERIRKTAWTLIIFLVVAIFAYLVVFAGLRMELKQCKENYIHLKTHCVGIVEDIEDIKNADKFKQQFGDINISFDEVIKNDKKNN